MPLFIKLAIFFWCIFSIQSSWPHKRSIKINIILYDRCYLQNCISITFEKVANQTKYKKPNIWSHLNIFWLNFGKANRDFFHPFLLVGETDFWQNAALGISNFLLPIGRDDKNLGASFDWGGAWVKTPRINAFSRNVNSINLTVFCIHGRIQTFERKLRKQSGERQGPREFIGIC